MGLGLQQEHPRAKLLQALLQNTLEQTVLATIVYHVWAILMPKEWHLVIPLAALSFVIGRNLFFWLFGWRIGTGNWVCHDVFSISNYATLRYLSSCMNGLTFFVGFSRFT
tara:strand:- start:333 stop:662 length:330 start_codon:yes stop_codon:yes gene_type:complete